MRRTDIGPLLASQGLQGSVLAREGCGSSCSGYLMPGEAALVPVTSCLSAADRSILHSCLCHPSVHSFIQQDLPLSTQYQALCRIWGQGYQAQVWPQHLPHPGWRRGELGKRVYPQHLPNPGWRRGESWVKGYVEILQGWMVRCLLI